MWNLNVVYFGESNFCCPFLFKQYIIKETLQFLGSAQLLHSFKIYWNSQSLTLASINSEFLWNFYTRWIAGEPSDYDIAKVHFLLLSNLSSTAEIHNWNSDDNPLHGYIKGPCTVTSSYLLTGTSKWVPRSAAIHAPWRGAHPTGYTGDKLSPVEWWLWHGMSIQRLIYSFFKWN